MPMYTTWVSRRPGSSIRAAPITCPTISPAPRLRSSPIVPVKQKAHAKPQPTWVDTQSVSRSPSGISTDCTRAPSGSAKTIFSLPSCDGVRRSTSGTPTNARSDSARRKSRGRSDMASMSTAAFL